MLKREDEMRLEKRKSRVLLGRVKFEMHVRHPCGDIRKESGRRAHGLWIYRSRVSQRT